MTLEKICREHTLKAMQKAKKKMRSPKEEAFTLFGEQQNFTEAEKELFWKVINAKSIKAGININDLF